MTDHPPFCLLLNPQFTYTEGSIYRELTHHDPPLGLARLASVLIEAGFPCELYDLNTELRKGQSLKSFLRKWKEEHQVEAPLIGIPTVTTFFRNACELAAAAREIFPKAVIIAGGPHATVLPGDVLRQAAFDFAVIGEGERTLLELTSGQQKEQIHGIAFRDESSGEIIITPPRERARNLDVFPMPAYHLLRMDSYRPVLGSYKSLPAANMVSSRGCPGRCTFCCRTFGNLLSFHSAGRVVDEIEMLVRNFGIRQINFYDDAFTLKKERLLDICDQLIARKLRIDWTCFARIDQIDAEMLGRMKKAGCYQIMYGIENFNTDVLKGLQKSIKNTDAATVIRMTRKAGIRCRISLLVGSPGDTPESVRENIRRACQLNPDILIVNITTPFPGTDLFDRALKEDRLLTTDWSRYDGQQAVMRIDGLSPAEVASAYRKMYRTFYLRPQYIFSQLIRVRTWLELRILLSGFAGLVRFWRKGVRKGT